MKKLINLTPERPWKILLGILPFALIILAYLIASDIRLSENPNDKLLPSLQQMGDAIQRMAFEPNKRSGEYLLWADTASSLTRLITGVVFAAILGLSIGLLAGALPLVNANVSPLLTVISLIPPLALLPILFIVFGLGEVAKVALIMIGITPIIARDMLRNTREIPAEQIIKAQTLGANTSQIILRVYLPQLLPRLIQAVGLTLGTAWLFLISAEAIAATDGLGYRIFLVRRYLAMDVIIPYVIWITLLAFLFDFFLRWLNKRLFPWYVKGANA
jgi:NitT/TauT family transport system permease protein